LDPDKRLVGVELRRDFAYGESRGVRQGLRGDFAILDFSRDRENGIDLDTDRQLIAIAVVNVAPARTDFKGALLLALGALPVIGGMDDVKKIQAGSDHRPPKPHNGYQNVNPPR